MKKILGIFSICSLFLLSGCVDKVEQKPNNENKPIEEVNNNQNNTQNEEKINIITDGSKLGELQKVDVDTNIIKGIIITTASGQHDYLSIEDLISNGYNSKASYDEFYLNEWVELFLDVDNNNRVFDIFVVKNEENVDYSKKTVDDLKNICANNDYPSLNNVVVDLDNNNSIGSFYINPEYHDDGLYNIFITNDNKVIYMIQLNFVPERI